MSNLSQDNLLKMDKNWGGVGKDLFAMYKKDSLVYRAVCCKIVSHEYTNMK